MDYCGKSITSNDMKHGGNAVHKEKWVDIAKGLAILAVITDHSRNILYTNDKIQRISFFSVTLFICIIAFVIVKMIEKKVKILKYSY